MDWRDMTDEQIDEMSRLKREAEHREHERILNEIRSVYAERGGVLYACQAMSPLGWGCGYCKRASFGREPTIGMVCECGAMVKEIGRGPSMRTSIDPFLC